MHARFFPPVKLIALALVLAAFALRLYMLDNQSFAFDEGWTSYAIHHSWQDIWSALAPDNHPPLYYVLVKAFAEAAGYADFALRFFSAACSTVLVATLYALGKRLGGEIGGVAAALFSTSTPSFVYFAQEARMYSLLMLLAALSMYALLRSIDRQRQWAWWLVYVVSTSAALYTHYFALLLILAENTYWLTQSVLSLTLRREPPRTVLSRAARWVLGQGATLALYLPWLPTAAQQARIGQGTWWRMPLPAKVILQDIWRFSALGPRRPEGVAILGPTIGGITLTLLVALLLGWRRRTNAWLLALITWAVPVGMTVWIGSHLSIYTDRYALIALPSLALLIGLGASTCWMALGQRLTWLGPLAAVMSIIATSIGPLSHLTHYYHDPTYWREDFRRAADYLADKSRPEDTAILIGSFQPVMHYYRGAAPVLRFPQRGDSVQSEEEVVSLLRQYVRQGHDVRVVMYSWPTVDPQGLVEGQLRTRCELRGEHWQTETGQRPIRVINFGACDGDFALEPRQNIGAVWGDQVVLSSYRLSEFVPGRRTDVILWWRTLRRPDRDYTVFVHLMDANGRRISQFDKLPLSDFYPMRAWPTDTDQRDAYRIKVPAEADLDGAWLAIGLYDARTGLRLSVTQHNVPIGDFARIPVAP